MWRPKRWLIMSEYQKFHIIILSKEDKLRLIDFSHKLIDVIEAKTKNKEEIAFLLKIMVESFEEINNCKIPIR